MRLGDGVAGLPRVSQRSLPLFVVRAQDLRGFFQAAHRPHGCFFEKRPGWGERRTH